MNAKPQKILIVDDDPDNLANLSDILNDVGYQTETASDGASALEKVDQQGEIDTQRFDLCLLDFKMPGMDGAELLERIRQQFPEMKAIMITAYAGEDGVQKAIAAGTWEVLKKPVDVKRLLSIIDADPAN